MTLAELIDMLRGESSSESPVQLELTIEDAVPPQLLDRLARLARLGLLRGDVVMSMVAQAPLDPLGLVALLMEQNPAGWAFSAIDCSVVRVLVRRHDMAVAAAVRVDLLDDSVETLVLNKAGQLTSFQRLDVPAITERRAPGPWLLVEVRRLCDEATVAAAREVAS